jgi:hypothetical protein
MDLTDKQSMLSMGYREAQKDYFLKPIGFQLITIEINRDKPLISNWFKAKDGIETLLWDSDEYNKEDSILDWIKCFESNTRLNIHSAVNTSYNFLLPEQALDL